MSACQSQAEFDTANFSSNPITSPSAAIATPEPTPLPSAETTAEESYEYPVLDLSPYKGFVLAEDFVWGNTAEQLTQEYVVSLHRGEPLYPPEKAKEMFLGDKDIPAIEIDRELEVFANERGCLSFYADKIYHLGSLQVDFNFPSPIPEEEQLSNMERTPRKLAAMAREELASYFPQDYLEHIDPQYEWDYEKKVVHVQEQDEPANAPHDFVWFRQMYENGIFIDSQNATISMCFMSDMPYRLSFQLYDFQPAGDSMQRISLEEALALVYKRWTSSYHESDDEVNTIWQIELLYSNMTNLDSIAPDLGQESDADRFDLHWVIRSSHNDYYVNCIHGGIWGAFN